jgi:phage-related protein
LGEAKKWIGSRLNELKTSVGKVVDTHIKPITDKVTSLPQKVTEELSKGVRTVKDTIGSVGKEVDKFGKTIHTELKNAKNGVEGVAKDAVKGVKHEVTKLGDNIVTEVKNTVKTIHDEVEKAIAPDLSRTGVVYKAEGLLQWYKYETLYTNKRCTSYDKKSEYTNVADSKDCLQMLMEDTSSKTSGCSKKIGMDWTYSGSEKKCYCCTKDVHHSAF